MFESEKKKLKWIIDDIKNWMRQYEPVYLFKWIELLSIHPSNQKFQIRFDFLIALLSSIHIEEFKQKKLDHKALEKFIFKFKENSDSLFQRYEDFTPFSQLKLIPYFFNREKFFFFYGQLERPYEKLRILEKIFIFDTEEEHSEFNLIKDMFKQVLEYQTKLLIRMSKIKESNHKISSKIYIPSLKFYEDLEDLIMIGDDKVLDSRFVLKIGADQGSIIENFSEILGGGFFKKIYFQLSDKEFTLILPHLQIEVFFTIYEAIVNGSKIKETMEKLIQDNLIKELGNLLKKFFGVRNFIKEIKNDKGKKITNKNDLIILRENNLLIFNLTNIFPELNSISNCYENLKKVTELIKKERMVFLELYGSNGYLIPVHEIRILNIIIYEPLSISPKRIGFNFRTSMEISVYSLMDIISIFELISSPSTFLKFMEERYKSESFITFDQIDIFASFIINNESLPSFGGDMIFLSHTWSHFYDTHLYNKYQDSIYELIEREFPGKFNIIKMWNDERELYECVDTRSFDSANIIKFEDNLIWIINPVLESPLTLEDLEIPIRVIGPLYADYMQRIINQFKEFLENYISTKRHALILIPEKICQNNPYYNQFKDHYLKVNLESPIIVKSLVYSQLKLISMVFFNDELFGEKFLDSTNNDNCKYAVRQLIYSIIENFEPNLSEYKKNLKTDEFIKKNFPNGPRDYFHESIRTRNADIKKYPPHLKLNLTDQQRILKEIESYLREQKIDKKHYNSIESKQLFNKIYSKFYKRLELLLSKYDISILYQAYKQLELVEAERQLIRIEAGMRMPSQLEDDYIEIFNQRYEELSKLSMTHRFIVENLLKFGIKGTEKFNTLDYGYVIALSFYLISISQFSDFIHNEIVEFTINIKDFHKFEEIISSSAFNYNTYKVVEFKNKLESSRDLYVSMKSESQRKNKAINASVKEKLMIENLENAFKSQFSFNFTNMMRTLSTLSTYNLELRDHSLFPLILTKKEELINNIQSNYEKQYRDLPTFTGDLINEISRDEIQSILNYLSLDFHTYDDTDNLLHLRLMKNKNRLTLCPLLKLDDQYLFGKESCNVAFNVWSYYVFNGMFPYKISEKSEISKALKNIHSHQDEMFEEECGRIALEALGKDRYILRLKNFQRISKNLPKFPESGEIDLLAVNPRTKTCFILDSKNYFLRLNPSNIKNEIHRFIDGSKSDLKKLLQKEEFVRLNFALFLEYFKIKDQYSWKFKKGFVIKHNFPSAYIPSIDADFIFQNELESYLKITI